MVKISDRELYSRARIWWDTSGRKQIKVESNVEEVGRRVTIGGGKGPGLIIKGAKIPSMQNGILQGLPWDDLNVREKKRIIKVWYDENIGIPEGELVHQVN